MLSTTNSIKWHYWIICAERCWISGTHLFNIPNPVLDVIKWPLISYIIYQHNTLQLQRNRSMSFNDPYCGKWQFSWSWQGSTKTKILVCPVGKLHFNCTRLKLFWTSPKLSRQSNKPCQSLIMLVHWVSDQQNLLAQQENLLAPGYWT